MNNQAFFSHTLMIVALGVLLGACPRRSSGSQTPPEQYPQTESQVGDNLRTRETSAPIVIPTLSLRPSVRQTTPNQSGDLILPGGGESPRYPRDFAIGTLGRNTADVSAYETGRSFLSALVLDSSSDRTSLKGFQIDSSLVDLLRIVKPTVGRLSSGSRGSEGEYSFLIRFIGPVLSVTGELYLVRRDGVWQVDDLRMDVPTSERFDPLTYTRFF